MNTTEPALAPAIRAHAEALVREFFSRCFWYCRHDFQVTDPDVLRFVIRQLREHGGKAGWREAARLVECR